MTSLQLDALCRKPVPAETTKVMTGIERHLAEEKCEVIELQQLWRLS